MVDKFVKETFLKLTSKTYPYGYELGLLPMLPSQLQSDKYGNYFMKIGESKTVFACHLDTACKEQVNVTHEFQEANGVDYITTDGKSILGADDKAGVTIILWMIKHNIPGLYYFFTGEEVGCIGSGKASKDPLFKEYNRIVSFDRKGTNSVITHQSYIRTCSDSFGSALCKALNLNGLKYAIDDTGVYTDSAEFTKVIPECTNISVGYYKEHTFHEHQDINHLIALCKAVINIKWDSLPASRDTKKTEWKSWNWDGWNHDGGGWDDTDFTRPASAVEHHGLKSYKKTRRGNNKSKGVYAGQFPEEFDRQGKKYYEDFDNEIVEAGKGRFIVKDNYKDDHEDFYSDKKEHYYLTKEKFFSNKLRKEEIRIIKEQYGDVGNLEETL